MMYQQAHFKSLVAMDGVLAFHVTLLHIKEKLRCLTPLKVAIPNGDFPFIF